MGLVEEQLSAVQGQVVSVAGFWSTILKYFFGVPVPLRSHYEIQVYTYFSLVTSKSRSRPVLQSRSMAWRPPSLIAAATSSRAGRSAAVASRQRSLSASMRRPSRSFLDSFAVSCCWFLSLCYRSQTLSLAPGA